MPNPDRQEPQPPELMSPWRTDARVKLQMDARAFARDVVLPIADELDKEKVEMPRSLIEEMSKKGWFGITIPAEYGGLGLGVFEYCLVSEELARAWLSVGGILARGQGLGTQTLDDNRRLELLKRSAQGKWIGAIALSGADSRLRPCWRSDARGAGRRRIDSDWHQALGRLCTRGGFHRSAGAHAPAEGRRTALGRSRAVSRRQGARYFS